MTEVRVFCDECQRWLEHDVRFCPLFPDVEPPKEYSLYPYTIHGKQGKKWTECVCLVHTCFTAKEKVDKEKASTYHDFV